MRRALWVVLTSTICGYWSSQQSCRFFSHPYPRAVCVLLFYRRRLMCHSQPQSPSTSPGRIHCLFSLCRPRNLLTSLLGWVLAPPGPSQSGFASFTINDGEPGVILVPIAVVAPYLFELDGNNNCLNCNIIDIGR